MEENEEHIPRPMHIDPKRSRFPFCIVWTPLPVLSWLFPFVGHMGICREDGVILDFAGPNFVCVDNFTFGKVARYVRINMGKDDDDDGGAGSEGMLWDDALQKSTQEFQHLSYSLLTCNCHCFVANSLNRLRSLGGGGGGWNVVNLATLVFLKGRWVSKLAMAGSVLPCVILYVVGVGFGGWTFLKFVAAFGCLLLGWFLVGTYCLRSLIHL